MRDPQEAIAEILSRVAPIRENEVAKLDEAARRVLARDVASDVDLPPFEKSAMDGFAVHRADLASGRATLARIGESRAGEPFDGAVARGECVAIYTGAEVPADCDAVVMVEKSRSDGDLVHLEDAPRPRQNICTRGEDLRAGEVVLRAGRRLTPVDLSVLAAVGCDPVPVVRRARAAVLTTGDELVPPNERPGPGEIREGNTYHLAALARRAGADVSNLGTVRDEPEALEATFRGALDSSDAVITTGGVSMGRYDLVGEALERIGVEPVFHKVAIKPGKPLWFGMCGAVPVFALPGNPVSCLVCHEVFVRPALAKLGGVGADSWHPPSRTGVWGGGPTREEPRWQYVPVRVQDGPDGVSRLVPIDWKGSADIVALTRADALAIIARGAVAAPGSVLAYLDLAHA